jgi:antitoxin component YwqK of YwqJK toxin-antitoxin module
MDEGQIQMKKLEKKTRLYLQILFISLLIASCSHDTEKEYFDNGKISYEAQFVNDTIHGQAKKYYKDGSIMQISNWENGEKQGKTTIFFRNGSRKAEAGFVNGKQHGILQTWDSLGVLLSTAEFENGIKRSYIEHFKNGKINLRHVYKEYSIPFVYEYFENGGIKKIYLNDNRKILYYKAFDSTGSIINSKLPVLIEKIAESNKSIKIRISLEHTIYDSVSVGVIFGNLDKQNQLLDTLDMAASYGRSVEYEFNKMKSKSNEITGYLFELEEPAEMIRGANFFKFRF